MDSRMRLQPGVNPFSLGALQQQQQQQQQQHGPDRTYHDFSQTRTLPNPNALRGAPGLVPSLSTGQGFYTVESLQGASVVPSLPRQEAFATRPPHMVSHDTERSYAGGLHGPSGQQGLDPASLNYLMAAHLVDNQKLALPIASSSVARSQLPSHSVQDVHMDSAVARATGSVYAVSRYSQMEPSLVPAHYPSSSALGPSNSDLLLREQERLREIERDMERARERDRQKEREIQRERELQRERERAKERAWERERARAQEREHEREREIERERRWRKELERREWLRERRYIAEQRWEVERRRELEKRREIKHMRDLEHEVRTRDRRSHKKEASLNKHTKSPLRARRSDMADVAKSKILRGPEEEGKAWCSLCEFDCNTQEMLDRHRQGRKHKAQVEAKEQESGKQEMAIADTHKNLPGFSKDGETVDIEKVNNNSAQDIKEEKGVNVSEGNLQAEATTQNKKIKSVNSKLKTATSKSAEHKMALKEVKEAQNIVPKGDPAEPVTGGIEVETEVEDLSLEGELKDVNVVPALSNIDTEDIKEVESEEFVVKEMTANAKAAGDNFESQTTEAVQINNYESSETHVKEATKKLGGDVDTSKVENEYSVIEVINEGSNGDVDVKVLSGKDGPTNSEDQSDGENAILGKRSLDVDGDSKPAKKTRQLKKITASAASVQPGMVKCEVCKVICRNAKVYETHLKGEKHAERLKKSKGQETVETVKSELS